MSCSRREFLEILGLSSGAAGLAACQGRWSVPDRLVEMALRGPGIESHVNTVCKLCPSGCGATVRLVDGLPVGLKGNRRHPLNRGGLCPVGHAGLEVLYSPDRLRHPLRSRSDGGFEPLSWEDALLEVADRLRGLIDAGAGDRIAVLTGRTDPLELELARSFAAQAGSPHVAALGGEPTLPFLLTQGEAAVPGFDLEGADAVLSFGLDLFEDGPAPLWAVSSLVGSRPRGRRPGLLYAGSRLTAMAVKAEQYLAIRPGTHAAAALGIAHVLVREGLVDRQFLAERTFGFEDWTDGAGQPRPGFRRLVLERFYPDRAAALCGCEPGQLVRIARRLASASAPLAVSGGEAHWGASGTSCGLAVHALNALMGAFDRPGGTLTRQPIPFAPLPGAAAAAGSSSLFENGSGAGAFGADPVSALAEAVLAGRAELEVLLISEANPVHASVSGARLRQALERIPLVISLTPFLDETAQQADLVLPCHVYLEAWHESTSPDGVPFNVLGLGSPVIDPLYDTSHPAEVLLELARRIGGPMAEALPWASYADYLKERLEGVFVSGEGAVFSGSFEESWVRFLETRGWRFLDQGESGAFWRDLVREGGWWNPVSAPVGAARRFATPSGRYELSSSLLEERLLEIGTAAGADPESRGESLAAGLRELGLGVEPSVAGIPQAAAGEGEPEAPVLVAFQPMTGRGVQGAASPMLLEMYGYSQLSGWETWVEMSPETARHLDLGDGDRVALRSARGEIEVVVRLRPGSLRGVLHVPLGLGRQSPGTLAHDLGANPLDMLEPARDPISGAVTPAPTPVEVRLVHRRAHGGPAPTLEEHAL